MVEGNDDLWSVVNIMKTRGLDWDNDARAPFVEDSKSLSRLLDAIPVAIKSLTHLAVIVDADHDLPARWAQVCDRFSREGITLPATPAPEGTVLSTANKVFGVWVMPDNTLPGILEDFLRRLIPPADTTVLHAEEATKTAMQLGAPIHAQDLQKGTLHAWLAWRDQPGVPLGTALTKRALDPQSPEANAFVDWFNRVFLP